MKANRFPSKTPYITPPSEERLTYIHYQNTLEQVRSAVAQISPDLSYHNVHHAEYVATQTRDLAVSMNLDTKTIFNLQIAGWFHDVIYIPGRQDNEEQSARYARNFLTNLGFQDQDIAEIEKYILATKLDYVPQTIGEKIIKDADLSGLGTDTFEKQMWNVYDELEIDQQKFLHETYALMQNHTYFTSIAQERFDEKKKENMDTLEKMIKRYQYEN